MAKSPYEGPEITRELIDHYISEGKRMQSDEINRIAKHCYNGFYAAFRKIVYRLNHDISSSFSKLKNRLPMHSPRHVKH